MRYDHPNVIVRREQAKTSAAGSSSVLRFASFMKSRIKKIHYQPIVAGTATGFVVTARHISGTTTTVLGTSTLGTAASSGGIAATLALGTGNSPAGLAFANGDHITLTNGVDATGVYEAIIEYEALPDAVLT